MLFMIICWFLAMCFPTLMLWIVGGIAVMAIICAIAGSGSTNNQQNGSPNKTKPHTSTSTYTSTGHSAYRHSTPKEIERSIAWSVVSGDPVFGYAIGHADWGDDDSND